MTSRHELDPISLTFGLLFTGLGLLFLVGQADQALRLKWVWPLLMFAIGAAILLDVTRGRDRTEPEAAPEVHSELELEPESPSVPTPASASGAASAPTSGAGPAGPDPDGPVDNAERLS